MPPFRGAPGGTAGGSRGEGCGSPWGTRGRGPAPDEEDHGLKRISSTGMGGGARIVSVRGVSSRGGIPPGGLPGTVPRACGSFLCFPPCIGRVPGGRWSEKISGVGDASNGSQYGSSRGRSGRSEEKDGA